MDATCSGSRASAWANCRTTWDLTTTEWAVCGNFNPSPTIRRTRRHTSSEYDVPPHNTLANRMINSSRSRWFDMVHLTKMAIFARPMPFRLAGGDVDGFAVSHRIFAAAIRALRRLGVGAVFRPRTFPPVVDWIHDAREICVSRWKPFVINQCRRPFVSDPHKIGRPRARICPSPTNGPRRPDRI